MLTKVTWKPSNLCFVLSSFFEKITYNHLFSFMIAPDPWRLWLPPIR